MCRPGALLLSSALLICSASLRSQTAEAQPAESGAKATQAEVFYREGFELWEVGAHLKACGKFAASHQLVPTVGAALNVARCETKLERPASAYLMFKEAAALARREGDEPRAQAADGFADKLAPKLCWLSFGPWPELSGLVVRIDGKVTDNPGRRPINPGKLVIEASAPRHEPFSRKLSCVLNTPAEHKIEIALTALAPPPPPPVVVEKQMPVATTVGFISIGVGGAVAVAAAIAGGVAWADRNDAADVCPDGICNLDNEAGQNAWAKIDGAKLLAPSAPPLGSSFARVRASLASAGSGPGSAGSQSTRAVDCFGQA